MQGGLVSGAGLTERNLPPYQTIHVPFSSLCTLIGTWFSYECFKVVRSDLPLSLSIHQKLQLHNEEHSFGCSIITIGLLEPGDKLDDHWIGKSCTILALLHQLDAFEDLQ